MNSTLRTALWRLCVPALCLTLVGCGTSLIKVKGRVSRGGKPIDVSPKDELSVTFSSYVEGSGSMPDYIYVADVEQDGSFSVVGPKRKGIPRGRYRVGVRVLNPNRKDKLGEFGIMTSPIVREVKDSTEMNIDLNKPEA